MVAETWRLVDLVEEALNELLELATSQSMQNANTKNVLPRS